MASPDRFARSLLGRASRIEENGADAVRRLALAALQGVIFGTPVDEGRARSNWLVGVNRPRRSTQEPLDQSGQGALAEGQAQLAAIRPGDAAWISNNLPYIVSLNRGSSPQAAAGYVEQAVEAAARALGESRLLGG